MTIVYVITFAVGVFGGWQWARARRLQRQLDELWDIYAASNGWTTTPPAELVDEVSR